MHDSLKLLFCPVAAWIEVVHADDYMDIHTECQNAGMKQSGH